VRMTRRHRGPGKDPRPSGVSSAPVTWLPTHDRAHHADPCMKLPAHTARYGQHMTDFSFTVEMREVDALAKQLGVSARITRRAIRYAIQDLGLQQRTGTRDQMQRTLRFDQGASASSFVLNRVQVDRRVKGNEDNPAARVHINLLAGGSERTDLALPVLQEGGRLAPGASRRGERRSTITIAMSPGGNKGVKPFTPFTKSEQGRALVSRKDPSVVLIKMRDGQSLLVRNQREKRGAPARLMRTLENRQRAQRAWDLTAAFRSGGLLSAGERITPTSRSRSRGGRARSGTALAILVKNAEASKKLRFYELAEDIAARLVPTVAAKIEAILAMRQRAAGN
jgi:hypothetical protein